MAPLVDGIPWYVSRTVWGTIVGGVSSIALLFGHAIDAGTMTAAVDVLLGFGSLIGNVIALYGRLMATQQIVK